MDWGEIKNHLRQGKGGNADPGLERPPHPAGGHPCQRRCASHRRQGLSGVRRNTPGNHDTRRVLIVLSLVAFRPFRPPKFPRSTKPAPPSLGLAGKTGQHRLFPAPGCVLPHPLQNRVPRVQVLLPLPKNRRKHWVFAGFLFACVAWLCGALWFGHWVFSPWFYSFPTVLIPSSTQNAPGFAFFWLNRVRFPLFCCFSGAKFSCWFLCILPHSGYKLKPSVIPCRREVSFLT